MQINSVQWDKGGGGGARDACPLPMGQNYSIFIEFLEQHPDMIIIDQFNLSE